MNRTAGVVALTFVIGLAAPASAQDEQRWRELDRRSGRDPGHDQVERVLEARLSAQLPNREQARQRRDEAQRRRQEAARERLARARARRDAIQRGPGSTEQVSRTIRLGRQGTFELSNAVGNVVITGGGGDDVRIEATKRVWNPSETEAKAMLQELEVQITERTGLVEVRTVLPEGRRNFSAAVDYTVTVPSGAGVTVRTVAGDVRVTGVRGELRAETVNGNVTMSSLGDLRALRSVGGTIEIDNAEGSDVTFSTGNGVVTARNLKARTIALTSIGGDVRFTDIDSERVNVRSINGDIDYTGRLARTGRYELQSHGGDIRVTPSNTDGFELEAGTLTGDVRSDFALTLGRGPAGGRGPRRSRAIRGSFGDGGASLLLRSFNGNIEIRR